MLSKVIQFFHATKKFLYSVFYMKERSSTAVIGLSVYMSRCAKSMLLQRNYVPVLFQNSPAKIILRKPLYLVPVIEWNYVIGCARS
jgi:hypothetical protein